MNDAQIKLSILLPVRYEGVNIPIMLKILDAVVEISHEILIVYDDPDDDCKQIVTKMKKGVVNVRLIYNALGSGVANAIKEGVREARGEYILIFAADEVGPVVAIEDMLTLLDDGCDFVSCTRYAHGGRRLGGSLIGYILSRLANRLFCSFTGSALTDSTTGIKMFKRSIFERIKLEAKPVGWAVAFELAIKAQIEGLKLGEVPIISIDRLYGGKSTFSLGPWFIEYIRWFFWGMRNLRQLKIARQNVKVRIPIATPTGEK